MRALNYLLTARTVDWTHGRNVHRDWQPARSGVGLQGRNLALRHAPAPAVQVWVHTTCTATRSWYTTPARQDTAAHTAPSVARCGPLRAGRLLFAGNSRDSGDGEPGFGNSGSEQARVGHPSSYTKSGIWDGALQRARIEPTEGEGVANGLRSLEHSRRGGSPI
ncbi:hypothetical protein K488DRAFT_67680 [Vararia minispora EC-137]|uniref:Uncharacterized protein n=1 Tax=Vararia minispora EC-137 TaxID=1314806 RepID=A0ACB8QX25_9AGAM|nr:hypothetical protein K488DRAFT_67680 [Vararia minispora EC-137]